MNVLLFLGSGISFASGYPSVHFITKDIISPVLETPESKFLQILKNYDSKLKSLGITEHLTKPELVGSLYQNDTSYEDLYYLCEEIAAFNWGLHTNALVPAFVESLPKILSPILKTTTKKKRLAEIGSLAHEGKKYINSKIIEGLSTPTKSKGLDLILQLANDSTIHRLNIITLNHDLLVETFFTKNHIEFEDGFEKEDGDLRWFNPDTFLSTSKIKLLKLHGSIDWYSFLSGGYERVAKVTMHKPEEKKDAEGKLITLIMKEPKVLSGLNKISFYNSGIYTDIHYHFQKMLYENNLMIMSGYGWGDDPINNRLMTWLDRKKENKLILLHERPDELQDRSMVLNRDFSNWQASGKLVSITKWMENVSKEEVLKACSTVIPE